MRGRVVALIEEHLRRAAVRDRKRERDGSAHVRLLERIIGYRLRTPRLRDRGIAVDAELGPARRDAEEAIVVVVAVAHERDETVGAARRPRARDLDRDRAL